jgi:hypothetical protein
MDDGRRLAAEFEHAGHHIARRRRAMATPVGTEPVKTIWFDARMAGQRGAGLRAESAQDVDRASRQAGRLGRAGDEGACQRVSSGVFTTQALPVASAGASDRAAISSG